MKSKKHTPTQSDAQDFLIMGGEMGERIRAFDWSSTPLGPMPNWSPALRTMLRILLANRFPHILWWGPQYIQFYNDPYRPVLGAKHHDRALGRPASECWAEIWNIIGPLIDRPFNSGPATWDDDIFLEIHRHGFLEECHFTIAYSPVPDETAPNGIGGVLATVHEITGKVVGDRRVLVLRDLGAQSAEARTAEDACAIAAKTLAAHSKDIPFALLYLIDPDRKRASLAGSSGVAPGDPASPSVIALEGEDAENSIWPLGQVMRSESMHVVQDFSKRLGGQVPPGPWTDPPHTAAVVPIRSNKAHYLAGFLVAGVSARLQFDQPYHDFLELVASQIATAIANAREYEEEKKRAEALEEIDRAKTIFFSNVSHGFRTPLTLMLGPVEDLLATSHTGLSPAAKGQLENEGATFIVRVPLEPIPKNELLPVPCPSRQTDENRPWLIVADDNADMRQYLARILAEKYDLEAVPDGEAALAAARERRPDLILSDIRLDGLGLVREIRADAELKTVPIILLSARVGEEARVEGMQQGADDYLIKPFSARELLARVAAHLEMARIRKESEEERERLLTDVEDVRRRLEAVVQNSPIGICVWRGPDLVYELANPAYKEFAPGKQFLGKTYAEMWPEAIEPFMSIIRKVMETGEPYSATDVPVSIKKSPDGQLDDRFFNFFYSTLPPNASGQVGVLNIAFETTDRKRAEEALRNSERLYRAVGESIDYGVWVCAPDGRNIYASESFLKLVGITQEQCSEFGWGDVLHPDDAERTIAAWKECARTGSFWDIEHRFRGVDGQWHPILARGLPVRNEKGEILCWAGINLDIYSLKRTEEALQKAKDEMEIKVQERTAQLAEINESLVKEIEERKRTEQRLRAAQKNLRAMAAEIVMADERSRQHFAADLHDTVIQTIGAAKMRSHLIQDDIPEKVSSNFRELQDLISQSITQARFIMAEMSPPVLNELGFIPAMEWITEQIETQHGINIELDSTDGFTPLQHEIQVLLFQATRELLMNVVKHARADKALVKISGDKKKVRIEVVDDGKGFDKRQAFRTDVSGGGFGLFSIRERIRHFGGHLLIQSEEGKGTRIVMTSPRTSG